MRTPRMHRVYTGLSIIALAGLFAGCVDATDAVEGDVADRGGSDGGITPDSAADDLGPSDDGVDGAPPRIDMARADGSPPGIDMGRADGSRPEIDMAWMDAESPDAESPDAALPDAGPPPDCPTLTTGGETRPVGPCHVCRASGDIPPGFEGWAVVHVDPAAAPGGDGSAERPLIRLSEAAEAAAPRTVFALADGVHSGPVDLGDSAALVGGCAERVRIAGGGGRVGVVYAHADRVVIDGVTVDGEGGNGLVARDAGVVEVRRSVVRGGRVAIEASRVATLWVVDSRVEDAGIAHVLADEAGVSITRSIIGPGPGPGVVSAVADAPVACDASASPVCPYRAGIYVTDSLIGGVLGRGIDALRGRVHVRRSVIEDVERVDDEPIGLRARQSFVVVDGQTVVRRVGAVGDALGVGIGLESSRSHVGDVEIVDCGNGGLSITRSAPEALLPFAEGGLEPPSVWFPGEAWSPRPEAFAGDGFEPGANWFPGEAWAPRPDELPFQLRPETPVAAQSPELGLFRWARSELRGTRISGHPGFGAAVSGHAVRVDGAVIGDIGAGPALSFTRLGFIPLDVPGSDVVALGEVLDLEVSETGGVGLQITGAALVCGAGGDGAAPCTVPPRAGGRVPRGLGGEAVAVDLGRHLSVRGGRISQTRGIGVSLVDSVATLERMQLDGVQGIGVWSYGSKLTLRSSQIRDVRFHNLTGRFDAIDVADGIIIEPGRWMLSQSAVIRDISIIGAERVGLLLVNDRVDLRLELALGEGRLADNGVDVVVLGEGRFVEGLDGEVGVENHDERAFPPPAPPYAE